MTEYEPKIKINDNPENTEEKLDKIKRRFFSGLKNRLLALATAGFITLGAGWARELSQQLEIEDKKGAVAEFILEREVTNETLVNFKEKIKKEEPEFVELANNYKRELREQLDSLEKDIAEYDSENKYDHEYDQTLINAEHQDYENGIYRPGSIVSTIDLDHQLIKNLKSDPGFLKRSHDFLKTNLEDIFWCFALLNNSKDSRDALIKFIKPPTLVFKPHALYAQPARATTIPSLSFYKWHSEVIIYPMAFSGLDNKLNLNTYTNIFIHEFGHTLTAGSGGGKKIDRIIVGNDFGDILDEGRIQSLTYKIIRFLNRHNQNLKPVFEESDGYDQYLVIAEIIEGIARTHSNADFLIEWQLGIIDYQTMLSYLKTALKDLGLEDTIYQSIVNFKLGQKKTETSTRFTTDLLAALKLNKVNLSEDFNRSILRRDNVRH